MSKLKSVLSSIARVNKDLEPIVRARLDNLTKPPGSLGYLEDIVAQYSLMINTETPTLGKKRIYTFAADHGVVAEGITCYPSEVTPQMVMNMLSGGAGVNVLARHAGAEAVVVDIGVNCEFGDLPGLVSRKVRPGTANMAHGPAMTEQEAVRALEVGVELAQEAHLDAITLLGTGEMGIGNTTPSSALLAALLPCDINSVTGRGTGISNEMLKHKTDVIRMSLEANRDRLGDPVSALAAVGGLEIAGIAGLCIGGAACRIPVVVDGFISSAGALVACAICEEVRDYLFFSHLSKERGHAIFVERFGVRTILDLDMRLGEGTGAALAMTVIDAALRLYNEMATFDSAGVSRDRAQR